MPRFSPSPGELLGPYQLLVAIGEGGMGEVWKAKDTRLDRIVAIKFAKEEFSERFNSEARSVAALNHPNICQLYDVGPNYLVMEFIEGTPLQGPLPVSKAVAYAGQILDALEAAHKKRITHRDLKPANILVTKQGIKLLDFGLAKQGAAPGDPDATVVAGLSKKGEIAGTLQYMSPEQLHGKEADARSDIFSFGCVLYELLSGKRAFEGDSAASVIAAVLEREPEFNESTGVYQIIRTCIAKDPDDRFQNARDIKHALTLTQPPPPVQATTGRPWGWIVGTAAASLVIGFGLAALRPGKPAGTAGPAVRLEIPSPNLESGLSLRVNSLSLSADGQMLAFILDESPSRRIWVRPFHEAVSRPVIGTEGASSVGWFSKSDGLLFTADGKLRKIPITGGAATSITDTTEATAIARSADGVIVFRKKDGVYQVDSNGAVNQVPAIPQLATQFQFLPDGRRFLYRVPSGADAGVYAAPLRGGKPARLLSGSRRFAFDGRYLYSVLENSLVAQLLDPVSLQLSPQALPVANNVVGASLTGSAGVVAFRSLTVNELTILDRTGRALKRFPPERGAFGHPEVSPDGKRVAVDQFNEGGEGDAWLIDTERGTTSRLTFGGGAIPVWTPDGTSLLFAGKGGIYKTRADGSDKPAIVWKGDSHHMHVSPDGKLLVFERGPLNAGDIWMAPLTGAGAAKPLVASTFSEADPRISPNGKWFAYTSNETGRNEVYVQSLPPGAGKWQISNHGGRTPRWRNDGRQLFLNTGTELSSVDVVERGGALSFGAPQTVIAGFGGPRRANLYSVFPDGKRFALLKAPESERDVAVVLVNWRPN